MIWPKKRLVHIHQCSIRDFVCGMDVRNLWQNTLFGERQGDGDKTWTTWTTLGRNQSKSDCSLALPFSLKVLVMSFKAHVVKLTLPSLHGGCNLSE